METNASFSSSSSSAAAAAAVKRPNVGTLRARRFLPYVLQTTLAAQSASPRACTTTQAMQTCAFAGAPSNSDGVLIVVVACDRAA